MEALSSTRSWCCRIMPKDGPMANGRRKSMNGLVLRSFSIPKISMAIIGRTAQWSHTLQPLFQSVSLCCFYRILSIFKFHNCLFLLMLLYSSILVYPISRMHFFLWKNVNAVITFCFFVECPPSFGSHILPLLWSSHISVFWLVCLQQGLVLGVRGDEGTKCHLRISSGPRLHHGACSAEKHHIHVSQN